MAVSLTFSAILARHIADINNCIAPSDLSTYADDLLQAGLITVPGYQSAIAVTASLQELLKKDSSPHC